MNSILQSLSKTIHVSIGLSIILFLGLYFGNGGFDFDLLFWSWLFRYIHVVVAIMWLGLIMAFNVWFVIWPNQKRALGIVECDPELKAKSAKTAMLFSRTNTLLSLPML